MKQWIDSLGYGNKNISGPTDSFWLNNKLKISPDEQLGLLKRLLFSASCLPQIGSGTGERDVMLQESNTAYKLSYKTGWGYAEDGNPSAVVGWIEENNHVYFVTFVKPHTTSICVRCG